MWLSILWKHWRDIDEVSLQVTPGDGETSLDGMFGQRYRAMRQNDRPGGCLAIGSRPDRSEKNTTFQDIIPSRAGESGEIDAHCLGKFNRKQDGVIYKKPKVLVDFLMDLFKVTPKLRAKEMRDIMAKAIDPEDGGLLFCPSKADTKGILLSEDTIQQFIGTQAKTKKS